MNNKPVKISSKTVMGFTLGIIAAIMWGTYGTFVTYLTKYNFSSIEIAIFPSIFMVIWFGGRMLLFNRKAFKLDLKGFICYLLIGVVVINVVSILYAKAMLTVPVAIASILAFCNVFVTMILAYFAFKDKITSRKIICAIFTVLGLCLVLNVFTSTTGSMGGIGLLYILGVMLVQGFSYIVTKYALEEGYDYEAILFYSNLLSFITLSFSCPPWQLAGSVATHINTYGLIVLVPLLGYSLFTQTFQFVFFMKSMILIEPVFVCLAFSFDPITASILGWVLFGQALNSLQMLGMLIVIVTIGWLQWREYKLEQEKLLMNDTGISTTI
ncbi:MAG: DMT family transporter [Dehalobacterium sp.]